MCSSDLISFCFPVTIVGKLIVLKKIEEEIAILEPNSGNTPNVTLTFKEGCVYDEFLKEYYKQKDIFVEKSLSFGSLETILSCIKVGMGKSLLPTSIVKKMGYDKDIRITVLPKKEANIPTCLVCRKDYNAMFYIHKLLKVKIHSVVYLSL